MRNGSSTGINCHVFFEVLGSKIMYRSKGSVLKFLELLLMEHGVHVAFLCLVQEQGNAETGSTCLFIYNKDNSNEN